MPISIAIDGPAGAGKSTLAKALAQKRNALYLDTGAMYRAVGAFMLNAGVNLADERAIAAQLPNAHVDVRYIDGGQRVYLNGRDVTALLRAPEISAAASAVSAVKCVREAMVQAQRRIAAGTDIVMDGRDIGTAVLPNADVKVFLTAAPQARAKRRYDEMLAKGAITTYETVYTDLTQRDRQDATRKESPLRKADDAVELDTTDLDIAQSVAAIERIVQEKCADRGTNHERRI